MKHIEIVAEDTEEKNKIEEWLLSLKTPFKFDSIEIFNIEDRNTYFYKNDQMHGDYYYIYPDGDSGECY